MKLSIAGLPEKDLASVADEILKVRELYSNREILIYGATGFIGTWLTSSMLFADSLLGLNLDLKIVTRNAKAAGQIFGKELSKHHVYQHNLSISEPNETITADLIFHGATPSRSATGSNDARGMVAATVNAAKHAAQVKSRNIDKPHVIHLNSGAIYGEQTTRLRSESDSPINSDLNPYVESKLGADAILLEAERNGLIDFQSPRLFAFSGPLLPLNEHFAIGNFLSDGLKNQIIEVKGNPMTTRSYMYPADLVKVLLQLPIVNGNDPINIGSNVSITMQELALLISDMTSNKGVYFSKPESIVNHYVPSTTNLEKAIGNLRFDPLETALEKWIQWLKS